MTYVIAEPCINTKDTACVDVCPVDCIHPRKDEEGFAEDTMLYIDPEVCIDCGACEPACPVQAIFPAGSRAGAVEAVHGRSTPTGTRANLKFVSWITKFAAATDID